MRILFLAGGLSSRMGQDKGLLTFNLQHLFHALYLRLSVLNIPISISVHANQYVHYQSRYEGLLVKDSLSMGGPLNGIFSVHQQFPEEDLLVVPCDMYLLKPDLLLQLIEKYQQKERLQKSFYCFSIHQQIEPFPCIFSNDALKYGMELYHNNVLEKYSMKYLIQWLNVECIETTAQPALLNFNTTAMLEQFYTSENQG